ncbi:hypothetical protein F5888DRAFT_1093662 [Russula emetica]|nr:hypothetical protein F5888DRAFT_1093662 [Russula emetica]
MRVAVVGSGVTSLAVTWGTRYGVGTLSLILSTRRHSAIQYCAISHLLVEFSPHEVHLYETDDRPGHANTVPVTQLGTEPINVDTLQSPEQLSATLQFIRILQIVFKPTIYPNFRRFLALDQDPDDIQRLV